MGTIASQITSLTIAYSTVYSDADERKYQSSASLSFVRGIYEKAMSLQISEYFNNIFSSLLSVFRKGYSCQSTL